MEFKEAIETAYPGVYVKSIQIGSNSIEVFLFYFEFIVFILFEFNESTPII